MTPRRVAAPVAPRDRSGGYLLIEALATLALSALVIAGLLSLSAVFVRSSDRSAARVERLETGPRTIAAIARDIRALVRLRWAGGGDRFVFLGLPDRIVFAIAPVQANGLRAPLVVAYQVPETGVALRAEAPLPAGATTVSDLSFAPARRLSVGAATLRFAYVDRPPAGGEIITDSWDKPDALPFAVRIDRVDPADGRIEASLRAPVVVDAEPGCAAPETNFCSRAPKQPAAPGPPQGAEASQR